MAWGWVPIVGSDWSKQKTKLLLRSAAVVILLSLFVGSV
jgi:hypothetical protein